MSDKELQGLRDNLDKAQAEEPQAVDDLLAADYSDVEPFDVQCDCWDVELVNDDDGSVIEHII